MERTVVELCPNCECEVEMTWDTEQDGVKAFCPVCGKRLMLCSECPTRDGCDWDSKTSVCRHCKDDVKQESPWTMAEDGMPKMDEAVLAFVRSGMEGTVKMENSYSLVFFDDDGREWRTFAQGKLVTGVTAWMSLPADPDVVSARRKPTPAEPEKKKPMTRSDILRTAEQMVCGQREQDYGTPEDNFSIIAYYWGIYIRKRLKLEKIHGVNCLSAADVANMMCLLKLARITTGTGTADSYVDIAGYAACGGEIEGGRHA